MGGYQIKSPNHHIKVYHIKPFRKKASTIQVKLPQYNLLSRFSSTVKFFSIPSRTLFYKIFTPVREKSALLDVENNRYMANNSTFNSGIIAWRPLQLVSWSNEMGELVANSITYKPFDVPWINQKCFVKC